MDERELIERAQGGDKSAFTTLYHRYYDIVHRFAYAVCHNKDYATEVVQDTFINVYRRLPQYDGTSKFSTWLYSIVVNNCQMHSRRTKLEQATISIEEVQTDHEDEQSESVFLSTVELAPDSILEARELEEALFDALQKLPLEYRLAYILRDIEHLSNEEAATMLGISVQALKSRLHRARTALRTILNEYDR